MAAEKEELMRRLSVDIPDSLHHWARMEALKKRITLAAFIREIMEREQERLLRRTRVA